MQLSCTFCFVWHAKSTKPFQRFWQPFLECGNDHIDAIWGVPRFAEVFGSEKVEQTFPYNSTKCGKENSNSKLNLVHKKLFNWYRNDNA